MANNQNTNEKTPSPKSLLIKAAAVFLAVVAAFGLSRYVEAKNKETEGSRRERIYAPMVEDTNEKLVAFKAEYPDRRVVLACEEDVTDDGLEDLLIIYKEDNEQKGEITRMVISLGQQDGSHLYTEPIPAPIENQGIQFMNIDEEKEIEFGVSGEKDGNAGYAIYRMIDGAPVNLFGEGMEDCC